MPNPGCWIVPKSLTILTTANTVRKCRITMYEVLERQFKLIKRLGENSFDAILRA